MAKMVKFLDLNGRPTIIVNSEMALRVYMPVEPTDGIKVALRGEAVTVGNELDEVLEILNSGTSPEYDLDDEGVRVDYVDPRKPAKPAGINRAPNVQPTSERASLEPKEAAHVPGFGDDVTDDGVANTQTETVAEGEALAAKNAKTVAKDDSEKGNKPNVARLTPRK